MHEAAITTKAKCRGQNQKSHAVALSLGLLYHPTRWLGCSQETVHFKAQPALSELREELFSLATSLWNEGASARIQPRVAFRRGDCTWRLTI